MHGNLLRGAVLCSQGLSNIPQDLLKTLLPPKAPGWGPACVLGKPPTHIISDSLPPLRDQEAWLKHPPGPKLGPAGASWSSAGGVPRGLSDPL